MIVQDLINIKQTLSQLDIVIKAYYDKYLHQEGGRYYSDWNFSEDDKIAINYNYLDPLDEWECGVYYISFSEVIKFANELL
jgi:hypothetical protein